MMRGGAARACALVAGLLACGLATSALRGAGPGASPRALGGWAAPTLDSTLSSASELPSPRLLEEIAGGAVGQQLLAIALDPNRAPGVRQRALASLAQYPSPTLRDALRALLDDLAAPGQLQPHEVWLVRPALAALATCGDAQDVPRLTTWLEWEASRDVRARAAWALGRLGQPGGIEALRKRFLRETVGQVAFQITAALALLEQ